MLTASLDRVAVAYHSNRTATVVAKIPGNSEYKELMQHLMISKDHSWPTLWSRLSSWGSLLQNTVAQGVGFALPAQQVLAKILIKLKVAADQTLKTNITKVIVSAHGYRPGSITIPLEVTLITHFYGQECRTGWD